MVVKTIIMLTVFCTPFILLSTGVVSSSWQVFVLYLISGFGMAGIGLCVMHDAIHGSYSKNKTVNTILSYSFNLIGANATVWRIQHNILHHTYTNIDHADDDLNAPFFLRFSPNAKHYKAHQYQHLYIWFFYSLSTISWITSKDFVRLKRFRDMGFLNEKNEYRNALINMTAWKLFYYTFALILPMVLLPFSWGLILLAFICMHFVTGLLVSIVFQVAHIMPENKFPLPNSEGAMNNNWYAHQFETTCNFAPKNSVVFWLLGGLNYQVEHHVLPDVCHIHYKKLSKIVSETALEFGMPYHVKKTFFGAIKDHTKMLRQLGRA